jgi:hypothetical protein
MRLYEVQAAECNVRPKYANGKFLATEDIDHARQRARDYLRCTARNQIRSREARGLTGGLPTHTRLP